MFRCYAVDERDCVFETGNDDDGAVIAPARTGDLPARQQSKGARDRLVHAIGEDAVIRDQNRLRRRIVLGLAQQIRGNPIGIVGPVRHHEDFRRPRDGIDADLTEHFTLGSGDIGIAGSDDLVDRCNG